MSIEQEKRRKMIEEILNHQVQGEVYHLIHAKLNCFFSVYLNIFCTDFTRLHSKLPC